MIPALIAYPTLSSRSPVVIINHGAPRNRADNDKISVDSYAAARDWFLKQGFAVVVPVRRGYGESSVTVQESYRSCEDPDYWSAGHTTANDIAAVIDYLRASPYIDSENIIVLGQSAGGWGSLALSSRNIPGVNAIINFAGGRGSLQPGQVCHPERLVETAQRFGASARVPTIWLYSENDLFFGPSLAKSMFQAYTSAGGTAEFVSLPSFRKDGHTIFAQHDGIRLWAPTVKDFLERSLHSRAATGSTKSN
jgi:dienelactone hydrolase